MNKAPERIYTNASGTAIITPPSFPLFETDIEWARADHIEELEAKLEKAVEHFKKLRRRQDCLETFDAVVDEVVETALAELIGGKDD